MSKSTTTRRGFLGLVAGAAPLAAAAAAAPDALASPTAPAPKAHDEEEAVSRERGQNPALRSAIIALTAAVAALGRLIEEHRPYDVCDLCLDADALKTVVSRTLCYLEGAVWPRGLWEAEQAQARVPTEDLPPVPAALIALYDVRDALLDMTYQHCDSWDCDNCIEADELLWVVRFGVAILQGEDDDDPRVRLVVAERELLSAERKVERERACEAAGAAFMKQSEREHWTCKDDLENAQVSVALVRQNVHGGTLDAKTLVLLRRMQKS